MLETIREYRRAVQCARRRPTVISFGVPTSRVWLHPRPLRRNEGLPARIRSGGWIESTPTSRSIRAALTTAIAVQAYDVGQETAGAIWRYWSIRSDRHEGRRWLSQLLAPTAGFDSPERVAPCCVPPPFWPRIRATASKRAWCLDEALRISDSLGLHHRKCQVLSDLSG